MTKQRGSREQLTNILSNARYDADTLSKHQEVIATLTRFLAENPPRSLQYEGQMHVLFALAAQAVRHPVLVQDLEEQFADIVKHEADSMVRELQDLLAVVEVQWLARHQEARSMLWPDAIEASKLDEAALQTVQVLTRLGDLQANIAGLLADKN